MKRSLCIFIVLLLMLPSMAGCSGQTTVPDSQLELLIADALSGKGRSILEGKSALERAMDVGSLDHWEAEHSADPEAHLDSVYLRLFVSVPTGIFEFGLPCVYQYWRDSDTWTLVSQSELEECGIVSYNEDFFNSFVGSHSGSGYCRLTPCAWTVSVDEPDYNNCAVTVTYNLEVRPLSFGASQPIYEDNTGTYEMNVGYDSISLAIPSDYANELNVYYSVANGLTLNSYSWG